MHDLFEKQRDNSDKQGQRGDGFVLELRWGYCWENSVFVV